MKLLIISILLFSTVHAQKQVLDKNMHHLRQGTKREWNSFPVHAKDSELVIHFNCKDPSAASTISLRQYDVNQVWKVLLNNKELGSLVFDEKDMTNYFDVPPSHLKTKNNILQVKAEGKNLPPDDIMIGEVIFDNRPVTRILGEAHVQVQITGEFNQPVPSRLTIVNNRGSLQQTGVGADDKSAVRTGYIYSSDGSASFTLPAGTYKIYATRGFEYGADSLSFNIKPGSSTHKKLSIKKEVLTDGWVSCDPHIHTFTFSRHGDATVRERILSIAGEGLEYPVTTEHNMVVDISDSVKKMGMSTWFTPITGNEVTTEVGHFNIFPVLPGSPVTNFHVKNWNDLSDNITQLKEVKVVILNHARDTHLGFRPFDSTNHINDWKFPANAMEVMNSGSQQTDPRQLYLDWMEMLNRGIFLGPVGSSDSHDVTRFIVGQARTYIHSRDNVKDVVQNFADGKLSVSFGLFTEIIVNGTYGPGDLVPATGQLKIILKVSAPSWVKAKKVMLFANGKKIHETRIQQNRKGATAWEEKLTLPKPGHDVYLVAVAEGPGINAPFWPIAKPFQHDSPAFNPIVLGVTGALKIDANGDGKFDVEVRSNP